MKRKIAGLLGLLALAVTLPTTVALADSDHGGRHHSDRRHHEDRRDNGDHRDHGNDDDSDD